MGNLEVLRSITTILDASHCEYELLEHEAYGSSAEASRITGIHPEMAAKSLLYKSLGGYVLAVLPASERVSTSKLRRALDERRVSMASPEELEEVMGCTPGTCHPIGILKGVRTVVDNSLAEQTRIGFSTGDAGHTIVMQYADYERVASPELVDILARNL